MSALWSIGIVCSTLAARGQFINYDPVKFPPMRDASPLEVGVLIESGIGILVDQVDGKLDVVSPRVLNAWACPTELRKRAIVSQTQCWDGPEGDVRSVSCEPTTSSPPSIVSSAARCWFTSPVGSNEDGAKYHATLLDVEAALGRPLVRRTVQPTAEGAIRPTNMVFDGAALPIYALTESVLLTLLLSSWWHSARWVRPLWVAAFTAATWSCIFVVVASLYLPTSMNDDIYFNRIVVDIVWLPTVFIIIPVLSALGTVGAIVGATVRLVNRGRTFVATRGWSRWRRP